MSNRKRRLIALGIAASLLTSCGTGNSSGDISVCPKIVEYQAAFKNRLADEIEALPAGTATEAALIDYRRLRDELRKCQ